MRRTILPLLLIICLLPAGCEKTRTAPEAETGLSGTAGLAADTVVAAVDGREVTAGQYLYWPAATSGTITGPPAANRIGRRRWRTAPWAATPRTRPFAAPPCTPPWKPGRRSTAAP